MFSGSLYTGAASFVHRFVMFCVCGFVSPGKSFLHRTKARWHLWPLSLILCKNPLWAKEQIELCSLLCSGWRTSTLLANHSIVSNFFKMSFSNNCKQLQSLLVFVNDLFCLGHLIPMRFPIACKFLGNWCTEILLNNCKDLSESIFGKFLHAQKVANNCKQLQVYTVWLFSHFWNNCKLLKKKGMFGHVTALKQLQTMVWMRLK